MRFITALIAVIVIPLLARGQSGKYCGSTEKERQLRETHPALMIEQDKLNTFLRDWVKDHEPDLRDEQLYIVPIVFHIIHDYGTENITDEQVMDAVRILNEDFRKLNADTASIVSAFKDVAADCKIEFRLATKTPGGTCTSGIEHIHSLQTHIGDDGSKLSNWPRNMYLNVWTVRSMEDGVAGYAYLPGSVSIPFFAPYDGVIILSDYVGSIGTGSTYTSRALTHEIGHSLNLNHTWGGNNSPGVECGDDGIFDTPVTEGWTSCNLNGQICEPGVIENVQNFMEYSYCSKMFTGGQAEVMQGTLDLPTADRSNLWTPENLEATGTNITEPPVCLPRIDFYCSPKLVCVGSPVTFYDVSWNGTSDSRLWDFGDGFTSTSKTAVITFETPGWKTVSLSCTNAAGTATEIREKYIYISPDEAQYFPGYWENFDDPVRFENDWIIQNFEGNSSVWDLSFEGGYYSASSVRLGNFENMNGDIDNLITPSFDLSVGSPLYLNFRYSCASNASGIANINDVLSIYSSTNCGQTWVTRATIKSTELANAGYYNNSYTPGSTSEWISKSILLPSSVFQSNVRFKFEYRTNGRGNNIYIDEVHVSSGPVGIPDADAASLKVSVSPNPVSDFSTVVMEQRVTSNASLKVVDVSGKIVITLHQGLLQEGVHSFTLRAEDFKTSGIFVLVAEDGLTVRREKIVVP